MFSYSSFGEKALENIAETNELERKGEGKLSESGIWFFNEKAFVWNFQPLAKEQL